MGDSDRVISAGETGESAWENGGEKREKPSTMGFKGSPNHIYTLW
jgi:hypothetical protein